MRDPHLAQLLERVTDDLPVPGHAAAAWRRAAVVRRRRTAVAAAAAVALVAGTVAAATAWQGDGGGPPTPAESPSPPTSPEPSGYEPQPMGPVTDDMVRDPLDIDADHPDDDTVPLPSTLQPTDVDTTPVGTAAVAVVQTTDGAISYLDLDGSWRATAEVPEGQLFPESMASDGGALAVRSGSAMEVYSLYAARAFSYDVAPVATTGLWANDSVGLFYDVPGPGGETREHEAARLTDPVAFPLGEGLSDVAMDPRGNSLHEFVDHEYVVWSTFQDIGIRRDTGVLGDLHRPVAQEGVVAVVRSGLDESDPTAADGVLVIGADLQPAALLPVVGIDVDEVVLHDFVDTHTLLIEVGDRLVTWNHRTGELRDVATLPPGAAASFAYWNLRAGS